jgi:hypothetical protein|tara:strand:+ start:2204 stop:2542 length:339 start_codon:yes stop_codon:yes gene_type:complete
MAKLLPTSLPFAQNEVTGEIFNRLVRIIELNLGQFDPNRTPQFNETEIAQLNFLEGDVIWNTTAEVLQVYLGNKWLQLHVPNNPNNGFEATASLGAVSVINKGDITVNITVA